MEISPDTLDWLLASGIPTVRTLTLTRLLDQPEDDPAVGDARAAIMTEGPVPAILAAQTPEGHWHTAKSYYSPKYTASHWSMMLLADLHADPSDERIRRGAAYMLTRLENIELDRTGDRAGHWACFWGHLLRYVVTFGYADDPRVDRIIQRMVDAAGPANWRCTYNSGLSCAWGTIPALRALAVLPAERRSSATDTVIQQGLDFLLTQYSLVDASYPADNRPHKLWHKLNMPLFYQSDILIALRLAADLNALDHPGARAALGWLAEQRQPNGRWRGVRPYNSRTYAAVAPDTEEASRWVTLYAADVLKRAGRLAVAV